MHSYGFCFTNNKYDSYTVGIYMYVKKDCLKPEDIIDFNYKNIEELKDPDDSATDKVSSKRIKLKKD